jgi:hypothetical protein
VRIHALFENERGQRQKGAPRAQERISRRLGPRGDDYHGLRRTGVGWEPGRGTVLEANLTGTGDTDGTGYFHATAYPAKNKICYRISASNIGTATAAHLHVDDAEDSVKLNLKTPPQDGSSVRECRRGLSERSVRKIRNNPANYYVDVHTEDFPDGAVRGQLTRPAPSP